MKLRSYLPTKYLTEDNPVIGLSFEVGYGRIAVMVGQTIIHTMANMIRGDYDSQIFRCIPAYMYRAHNPLEGGVRRKENNTIEVHSALTPFNRSYFAPEGEDYLYKGKGMTQVTGKGLYTEHEWITAELLNLRRERKLGDSVFLSMGNVGTVGHVDYGKTPNYLTYALYEKHMRRAAIEAGYGELDYMQRKLLNNGHSGISRKESGHSSLTVMCRAQPEPKSFKYKLTDRHGERGVIRTFDPGYVAYATFQACQVAIDKLAQKYYFTGEGMLPKGL